MVQLFKKTFKNGFKYSIYIICLYLNCSRPCANSVIENLDSSEPVHKPNLQLSRQSLSPKSAPCFESDTISKFATPIDHTISSYIYIYLSSKSENHGN